MWTYRQIGEQYTAEANLSFDMWRELASLKPLDRDPFITRALSGDRISRDEIRIKVKDASAAGNGSAGVLGSDSGLPDARGVALQAFVDALAMSGKLAVRFGKGEAVGGLLAEALDELIAKAMIVRGMLK